ncbi:unnamed protein product [Nyctereutes procyonoides]|uniref:(raccoon dog) hypothetical protein n=1 Tax=Nyctereutes procyonoides TaxID=34880 RepID=A0A811YXA1_NYCPR|nr:unnamed protein product [Nyctereutes procyonoides]
MEELLSSTKFGFGLILGKLGKVVEKMLPNYLSPQLAFHNIQWEIVMCPLVITLLVGLLFLFRLVQSVRSWLYVRHEKQLSEMLVTWIRKKVQLVDKLRATKKDTGVKPFSENTRLEKESLNITSLMDTYRKVKRTNSLLMEKLTSLIQELKEEKSKCSKQDEEMVEMFKMPEAPKDIMRLTMSQGAFPNLPEGPFPKSGPRF